MKITPDVTIYQTYIKDITDLAKQVQNNLRPYLVSAPKGIYVASKVDPVMRDGGQYFTLKKEKGSIVKTTITDISKCDNAIYSQVGDNEVLVIPKIFMIKKNKLVSNRPILPYHGIKLINAFVVDHIQRQLQWTKNSCYFERVVPDILKLTAFDPVNLDRNAEIEEIRSKEMYLIKGQIELMCNSLMIDIDQFIGLYDWNIYHISQKETELVIERSIDWRANEYINSKQPKEE